MNVAPGHWSFASKVVVGWIGAWLGSPVLGHWPHVVPNLYRGDLYYIPAILGAAAMILVAVDVGQMTLGALKGSRRTRR